jgi:outer membrane protein assembly factor BamB
MGLEIIYTRTCIGVHVVSNPSRRRVLAVCGGLVGSLFAGRTLTKEISGSTGIRAANADTDTDGSHWPMEQHDPGGTSYAPAASPPKDGVRIRWEQQFDTGSAFFHPTPVVANGLVYGVGEELVCVDSVSGDLVFRADNSFAGPPALADASVYQSPTLAFGTQAGAVGLNARGALSFGSVRVGLTRWQAGRKEGRSGLSFFNFGPSRTVPVAAKGTVFITADRGFLAIDASSGRVRWRGKRGTRRPAVHDDTVYITRGYSGGVLGYDIETGEQTFSFTRLKPPSSVTAVADGLIVKTTQGLVGIDYNETKLWQYTPDNRYWEQGGVAVANDVAYTGSEGKKGDMLVAIDTTDGTELWRSKAAPEQSDGRYAAPSVADGVVYVPIEGNELVAVDATNGHIRWRFTVDGEYAGWSPVALSGESLYILGNGHLYALEEQ